MILSNDQLKEIEKIIKDHINVLLYGYTGQASNLNPELLKKLGIPANAPSTIESAFVLGKIVQMMSDKEVRNMTFDELKKKAKEMSLSKLQRNSLEYAKQNSAQYVTALGHKMSKTINTAILQASKANNLAELQRQMIKDKVAESISKEQTRGKLASELYHNLEDWTRDWKRVAHTELWNAKLQGEVNAILSGETIYRNTTKGGETKVFRRPSADACNHCKRLYLEADGITPKIFLLEELINNGDNVGRKTKDWKPTTGTTHPNCTCPIAVVPDGFGFDKDGVLVFKD
ncbi:hypothetical protein [Bacillus phage YungSlug]|nr:hypothetical protein [Bacillus phage YungSlug]